MCQYGNRIAGEYFAFVFNGHDIVETVTSASESTMSSENTYGFLVIGATQKEKKWRQRTKMPWK